MIPVPLEYANSRPVMGVTGAPVCLYFYPFEGLKRVIGRAPYPIHRVLRVKKERLEIALVYRSALNLVLTRGTRRTRKKGEGSRKIYQFSIPDYGDSPGTNNFCRR